MIFRKQLLEIIDYAYTQAHDSDICVCPSVVPHWDDNNITDEMAEHQLHSIRVIRTYIENYDTNRRNVHPRTLQWFMSRFMDTEYSETFLSHISDDTFKRLKEDMIPRFDELSVTEEDVKGAWKEWFDWAVSNGTLISPHLRFVDPENHCNHGDLKVHDTLLRLAYAAIDNL